MMETLAKIQDKWKICRVEHLFLLLLVLQEIKSQSEDAQPIIQTKTGKVRGVKVNAADGKTTDAYFGIPFAKPPVGDLRFRHPQEVDPWTEILEADTKSNSCYQVRDEFYGKDFEGSQIWNPNTNMSEDCLYLNIWVPTPAPPQGTKTFSVMVWIYGGSFYSGSSTLDIYDGQYLASEENVIVVSLNYRVASLGFLYLDDRTDAPGNAGMMDQVMALQWIYDNIEYFGGIRENITVFGESAGAASVSMHLMSPLSQNLFSKAILQSSSALSPWAVTSTETMDRRSTKLGKLVNCHNDTDGESFMECMRSANASDLVVNEFSVDTLGPIDFAFTPVVDGKFLVEHPTDSVKKGNFKKTSLLAGSNLDEGLYFLLYFLPDVFPKVENVTVTRDTFLKSVKDMHKNFSSAQIEAIIFEYTDWSSVTDVNINRDMLDKMAGDRSFHCPTQEFASAYSDRNNDVYLYHYQHRYSTHPYPSWTGVLHGDELIVTFGSPLKPSKNFTSAEKEFSRKVMKYWANFAKTGNPNEGSQSANLVKWEKNTAERREYLILKENLKMASPGPRLRQCAFWRELVPKLSSLETKRCEIMDEKMRTMRSASTAENSGSRRCLTGMSILLLAICQMFI